jgi:hypothetical protein
MRKESTEAELDRYVESVVLSQASALGDSGALAAWMEEEAAGWREIITAWRNDIRQAPRGRFEAEDRAAKSRMVASARSPKTRH